MTKLKVLLIPELTEVSGFGHFYRMKALYDMLKEDFQTSFLLPAEFYDIDDTVPKIEYEDDLQNFIRDNFEEEICVLDGYSFDWRFQESLQFAGHLVVKVDDFLHEEYGSNLNINHAPALLSDSKNCAFGEKYALLRPMFLARAKEGLSSIKDAIQNVLITFGGADPLGLSEKAVRECLEVFPQANIHLLSRKESKQERTTTMFGLSEQELLSEMEWADLVVCPASNISLEVACIGRPMITGIFTDNQKLMAKGLIEKGVSFYAGDWRKLDDLGIRRYASTTINLPTMLNAQKELIDGRQAERIVKLFHELG